MVSLASHVVENAPYPSLPTSRVSFIHFALQYILVAGLDLAVSRGKVVEQTSRCSDEDLDA